MDSHAKAYEDLPHKPHGSRIINHIGGSIFGHEMPITATEVEYIEEAIPETAVQDDVVGGSSVVGDSVDEADETPEAEGEFYEPVPEEEVTEEASPEAKHKFEEEYGATYSNVADDTQETKPANVKKKGIQ